MQLRSVLCLLAPALVLFLVSAALKPAGPYALKTKVHNKDKYKLVWADEFNTDGAVDSNNWSFETGFVRNHELQWYQDKNVWLIL